jgi:hypothetical protein
MINRYFFYLMIMTMIVNVMAYVPNILIQGRTHGSIMGMLIGVLISTLLIYVFSISMIKYPGKGVPEILEESLPKWICRILLFYFATMWYMAGSLVLFLFSIMSKRFINPDMSLAIMLLLFIIVTCFGAFRPSQTILYILEIVIFLSVPFILFIFIKALRSPYLEWDAIWSMKRYLWKFPTLTSISASSYLFIGYVNMSIFNRVFEGKFSTKFFWVIPFFGLINLFSTVAIPIGFHGTIGVDDYTLLWVSTSDTLRLEFAFIERAIFPFLLLYINISLIFAIVSWHVSLELFKSVFPQAQKNAKWKRAFPWMLFVLFAIPLVFIVQKITQPEMLFISKLWLNLRFPSEIFLAVLLFFLSRKRREMT